MAPVVWLMGVPWSEAPAAGALMGTKTVLNEFIAYLDYVKIQEELSLRSQAIVTFALCGFANLSSIAMLLGGIGFNLLVMLFELTTTHPTEDAKRTVDMILRGLAAEGPE